MEKGFVNRFFEELSALLRGHAVLVYTMGKVGTSTLEKSLKSSGIIAIHLHNFSGEEYGYLDKRLNLTVGSRCFRLAYKMRLRLFFLACKFSSHIRIISMVRDPIARNFSAMFQGLDRLLFQATQLDHNTPEEDILQYIFDDYVNHESAVNWFHDEFRKTTDIDVENFPPDQRNVLRADKGKYSTLIIKLEGMDDAEEDIAHFLGVQKFELIRSNDSSSKWYKPLYSDLKKNLKLSVDYVDRMYEAPYLKRFYSDEELEGMKRKWAINIQ